jgi:xanthine dehydrogenase accessory factor
MGFELDGLRAALHAHGRITRVVIADVKGSSPREVGAAMLVWKGGQSGTIGGGALEYELARRALNVSETRLTQHALGPELGQCCGGTVQILTEVYQLADLENLGADIVARAATLNDTSGGMPFAVKRLLNDARATGSIPAPQLLAGWFIEPIAKPSRPLWIWGAGHVGRAMIDVYSPLPEFALTWIDTSADRFPQNVPSNVTTLHAKDPQLLVKHAPALSEHIILTYSHALDLELCHQLLNHGFTFAGLIGSKSKWARFQTRLRALGHIEEHIARITCPIGNPQLGKHPHAIAIGVGAQLLASHTSLAKTRRAKA